MHWSLCWRWRNASGFHLVQWSPIPSPHSPWLLSEPMLSGCLNDLSFFNILLSSQARKQVGKRPSSCTLALQGLDLYSVFILILNALALFRWLSFLPSYSVFLVSLLRHSLWSVFLYSNWISVWGLLVDFIFGIWLWNSWATFDLTNPVPSPDYQKLFGQGPGLWDLLV